MKLTKEIAVLLIFISILFAQDKNNDDYLGFAEGDNNIAIGFLAGWGEGEGFGVPVVWDHGAFGGMFSFGAEFRMWWAKYGGWVEGYDVYDDAENWLYYKNGYYTDKKYTKLGWSPMFRFMYHPFGMPVLKGQVKVANVLDPYVGLKFGLSVINNDKDYYEYYYENYRKKDRRDVHFPVFNPVAGIRWYFKDNLALWSEMSVYDFSLGINFKF